MGVMADDVTGAINVRTSYEGVTLRDVGGAITVVNQSGSVTVSGLRGDALTARHSIETSYDNIAFDFPSAGGTPTFQLETTYGQISSDFEGSKEERGSRQLMQSASGASGASITLTARSGSISLRQR